MFDYIDLMSYFPAGGTKLAELRFTADSHWNKAGHVVAANAIFAELRERGLLHPVQLRADRRE
jgi:hypothetical protein